MEDHRALNQGDLEDLELVLGEGDHDCHSAFLQVYFELLVVHEQNPIVIWKRESLGMKVLEMFRNNTVESVWDVFVWSQLFCL